MLIASKNNELCLVVYETSSDGEHKYPVARRCFDPTEFDAWQEQVSTELAAGYSIILTIVSRDSLLEDFDNRVSGGEKPN